MSGVLGVLWRDGMECSSVPLAWTFPSLEWHSLLTNIHK